MSAVCPACGVAVVPGYVKCPKCRAALPYGSGRRARNTINPGGTALSETSFPVMAIVIPIAVVLAIIIFFSVRSGAGDEDVPPDTTTPAQPTMTQQAQPQQQAAPPPGQEPAQPERTGTDPSAVAAELERTLRRQRLWSTIEINGTRIDVRSAACSDAAMAPALGAAITSLREAGFARLRCLAQSGTVVFERDL